MYVFSEYDNFACYSRHTERLVLYDAAQETGSSSTGSASATRHQHMREWVSRKYL